MNSSGPLQRRERGVGEEFGPIAPDPALPSVAPRPRQRPGQTMRIIQRVAKMLLDRRLTK